MTDGIGGAGNFEIRNASSNANALSAITNGTGKAGEFQISNASSSADAFYATTTGAGVAVRGHATGTGSAGAFQILNASSDNAALYASTDGTGKAGYFNGDVHVQGDITYSGTSSQSSDRRFKENITPIEGALDKVQRLRGVNFHWRREEYPDLRFKQGRDVGLIAQEVEAVLPEAVETDEEGYKSLAYTKLTALLVEAVKEQQALIDAQEATIDDLTTRLAQLEGALGTLADGTGLDNATEAPK